MLQKYCQVFVFYYVFYQVLQVFYKNISNFPLIAVNCNISCNSTQPAITCSKLTIETLEQGVKYVQS